MKKMVTGVTILLGLLVFALVCHKKEDAKIRKAEEDRLNEEADEAVGWTKNYLRQTV